MVNLATAYTQLVQDYCATHDEELLINLNELGKTMVQKGLPPEDIAGFHEQALTTLVPESFLKILSDATNPLAEILMAYGLSFRALLEQRYTALLQERRQESERLAAIGTLAAGIAHDFNTILGVIMGFTELTLDSEALTNTDRSNLDQVIIATERARDLIAKILAFARKEQMRSEPVNIGTICTESCALLRPTLPPGITIVMPSYPEDLRVMADPSDLRQIIINLAVNAADAMNGNGILTLSLASGLDPPPELPAGAYLTLTVSDTGAGMPPEIVSHIFDPFFTTKMPGKGSGLGLAVVHGIVQSLGGVVQVNSIVGTGTTFVITLPRC